MKLFTGIYDYCINLSKHRLAPVFLTGNSFIESIFWPIPVDIMLAPMWLARPERALHYAFMATTASVLGAVVGYGIGYYLYDPWIQDIVVRFNYQETFSRASGYLESYGVLFIVIGSFTPLPYKIVAISAGLIASQQVSMGLGAGQLHLIPFILVSFAGRGLRFFLIAAVIKIGGARMEQKLRRYIDIIGWVTLVILAVIFCYYMIKD